MMKKVLFILSVLIVLTFCACSNNHIGEITTKSTTQERGSTMPEISTTENAVVSIKIKIVDEVFTAQLYDNETAHAFADMLPVTLDMHELNGNEKYCYLSNSLPMNSSDVGNINTGDIMLYGSHCIVLFYDSFSTNYSYSKIGYIENPTSLADVLGSGNMTVSFEK